jgi:MFS family permease
MRALLRHPFAQFPPVVRRALKVDMSAALLFTLFTGFTGPFQGIILRRELGATPLQLSVLASAGAAFGLLSLVWVRLLHGRRPLVFAVWPGFLARSLFLLVPFVQSAWSFVAILVATNLLASVAEPANASVVQHVYPQPQRGRALATVRLVAGVLAVLLALVAGYILNVFSYRVVFPLAALAGMAASLRYWKMPVPRDATETPCERPGLKAAVAVLREDSRFRRLLAAHFVFGVGVWLQTPANPIMLHDVLRASTSQIGVFVAIGAVAGMLANGSWGRVVDRFSSVVALRAVYTIGAMTPIVLSLAGTPWVMMITAATEAVMATGLDTVWTLTLIESAGGRRTAQYVGISATLAGIRGVAAPLVSGLVIEYVGVHAVYLMASVCMASAVIMLSTTLRSLSSLRPDPVADVGVPQFAAS